MKKSEFKQNHQDWKSIQGRLFQDHAFHDHAPQDHVFQDNIFQDHVCQNPIRSNSLTKSENHKMTDDDQVITYLHTTVKSYF